MDKPDLDKQLGKIHEDQPPADDETTIVEARGETRSDQRAAQEERLKNLQQDREERKKYAWIIFWLVSIWLLAMMVLVVLDGFSFGGFDLDTSVLITLIGGTTGSVVTLFALVTKYLFDRKPR